MIAFVRPVMAARTRSTSILKYSSTSTKTGRAPAWVMVSEGDLRMFVSYGLTSTTEKAAEQTLSPFNRLGSKIEWRVSNAEGHWKPFATILRYFVQREETESEGQVLVVTKVKPGATCQIAYIDALANPDANELARNAADEGAPGFDCEADEPEYVGKFEAWER